MHRLLNSIKTGKTAGRLALTIFVIAIRVSGQNGHATQSSGVRTQSSVSKPGKATAQPTNDISCAVSGPNFASLKSDTAPPTPGQLHHVDLSWKASSSPGVLKYNVHRCSPGGACSIITTVTDTKYSDTQVQPLGAYCYFVTASAAKGPDSAPSNVVQVVIPSP